ncbi:T9SS type A sorting domain-containing protein [Alkaliflexus imshenetskii]|uniref:T9SS type A sorting domain-containing protein n=1 Tax=Alkaliflexus imshenetskii TaxID=286730 RepID=UPI0005C70C2D|nr:T9SS type A sorting domain-containing protein [Alkaliflexus imshenetskii]
MRIRLFLFKSSRHFSPKSVRLIGVLLIAFLGTVNANGQSMNYLIVDESEKTVPINQIEAIVFHRSLDVEIKQTNQSTQLIHAQNLKRITFTSATSIPKNDMVNHRLVNFYPNPVVDFLNIHISEGPLVESHVEIFSSAGVVVYKNVHGKTGDRLQINLSSLSPGLYFARVHAGTTIETIKFYKK